MRRVLEVVFAPILVLVIAAAAAGGATAHNGTALRGFGTAVIDGSFSAGEWDSAGRMQFTVTRSPLEGGGIVPATLYVMNDAQNLYIAIRVSNASAGGSRFFIEFDNNHDGSGAQEGEDGLFDEGSGQLQDRFMHQTSPTLWTPLDDNAYGGTLDGALAQGDDAGVATFEVAHPLDDADNAHDFSLRAPARVGFDLDFLHCTSILFSTCASSTSWLPRMDIDILSGSRIPPDTQITTGQDERSMTQDADLMFEFTGSDDVLEPSLLTFQCKLDDGAWQACTSPQELSAPADGPHMFSVRAIDDMNNLDPSPAERNWIRDSTAPTKPVIGGRRSVRKGKTVVLRLSARDKFTPPSRIRFKCSVDSRRLKSCRATYRVRLRPGRHVVRARALDLVGNQSGITTARVIVKRPPR